jgi:hypothetical protein
MKLSSRSILVIMMVLLSLSGALYAAPPNTISFQGYLKDANGKPVTTASSLTFRLYSTTRPSSGAIWIEPRNVIPVSGVYSVELGSVAALNLPFDRQYFLGVTVGSGQEMTPRQALSSVPYAIRATAVSGTSIDGVIAAGKLDLSGVVKKEGDTMTGSLSFGATTRQMLNLFTTGSANYGIGVQSFRQYFRTDPNGGFVWYSGGVHSTTTDDPGAGGSQLMKLTANGLTVSSIGVGTGGTSAVSLDGATGMVAANGLRLNSASIIGSVMTASDTQGTAAWQNGLRVQPVFSGTKLNQFSSVNIIAGAGNNYLLSGAFGATIGGGGYYNFISSVPNVAGGNYSTVPGGLNNWATGDYSFAAGRNARAVHTGTFVWGDAQIGMVSSSAANQFLIRAQNGVGINTTTPVATLDVNGTGYFSGNLGLGVMTPVGRLDLDTGNGRIQFIQDNVPCINVTGGGLPGIMRFRNSLEVWPSQDNLQEGKVDVRDTTGFANIVLNGSGLATVKVLEVTGGADIAEPFPIKEGYIEPGSVVVIDEEQSGRLMLSRKAYETGVAGVVSGANGIRTGLSLRQAGVWEDGQNVALSGRIYVKADAAYGAIKPGDLLTSSDTPGHAMKAADRQRALGAVIGKAMSSLTEGTGMVLMLVVLQ